MRRLGLPLVCYLTLAGCAASSQPLISAFQGYDGPSRSSEETATIYSTFWENGSSGLHGFIAGVDKKRIVGWTTAAPLEVYVLPGRHDVGLVYGFGLKSTGGSVEVDAAAGHTYEIKFAFADEARQSVRWWVEDKGMRYVRNDAVYNRAKSRGAR